MRIKNFALLHKIGLPHLLEVSDVFEGESIFMAPGAFISNRKRVSIKLNNYRYYEYYNFFCNSNLTVFVLLSVFSPRYDDTFHKLLLYIVEALGRTKTVNFKLRKSG